LDDRGRDRGTNFILRIKEQETHLTLHEHDDDDDDVKMQPLLLHYILCFRSFCGITYHILESIFPLPWCNSPQWATAPSLSRTHDHTQIHHTRYDSSARVIRPSQRPLPDNTQHSTHTDIHASGGIRTRNPTKRAAADPRPRPRGNRDQLPLPVLKQILMSSPIVNTNRIKINKAQSYKVHSCLILQQGGGGARSGGGI